MKYSKHYLVLLLFMLLAPFYASDAVAFKWLFLPIALAAVFIKSGVAFPGLVVYAAYGSNAYPVYIAMFLYAVLNYKELGRLKPLFITTSILLPFVLFHVGFKYLEGTGNVGVILNQFYMYFTLFGFFYGYLMLRSVPIEPIVLALSIVGVLHLLSIKSLPFSALAFLAVAFWGLTLLGSYKTKLRMSFNSRLVLFFLLILVVLLGKISFTILLSALFSGALLLSLVYKRLFKTISLLRGRVVFVALFATMFFAISNADVDSYRDKMGMSMSEVSSTSDLVDRAKMKFFADRAPIWKSVVDHLVRKPSWWFYEEVGSIELSHADMEFHGGSHNLYLETIRRMGYLPGFLVILLFISFHIKAGRFISYLLKEKLSTMLFIAVFAVNIVGSWSGNFPLMPNYAILGMVMLGALIYQGELTKRLSS